MDLIAFPTIVIIVLCIALSAFLSAVQTAFSALNRARLKSLAFGGNMKAERILGLLDKQDRLLSSLLIADRLADVLAVSLSGALFYREFGMWGLVLSVLGMLLILLFLGEAVPTALAKDAPEGVAVCAAPLVRPLMALLSPLSFLYLKTDQMLGKKFKPQEEPPLEEELITMVDEAQSEGDMDEHEGELIRSAIEFTDLDVRDILTPRVDVIGLPADSTMEEAADTFLKHGYSRLPVFRETMDNIVGILHEKDFYAGLHDGKVDIEPLMKPAVYAPATLKTSKLLKLLQSSKNHMAVIVDEFGGTEGIVTLEDVLEELVGEIYDEHDDVLEQVATQEDGSLLVDGGADLEEILELIHLEKEYEADTVGGWVAEQMGQIPKVGEGFEVEGIRVQATRVWKRRVTQVRIVPPELKEEAEALVGMNSIQ